MTPVAETTPLLGPHVKLDVTALIDARVLVQANSGGGKSYAIRKICELVYGAQVQVIVLDVEGEFHTLREKFDFTLVSTEGGDAPVSVEHAKDLARTLLEGHISAVIDLYELGTKRAAFIAAFLEGVVNSPRALWHDVLIIVDEANKYAPEDKSLAVGDVGDSKRAIANLMTLGRKRGFSGLLATQRISALDKDCAAECNSALIGRCVLDTDVQRAAKSLGMKVKDATELLPTMKPGEFCMYGDAFVSLGVQGHRVTRMRIGEVVTTHPKRGQRVPVAPSRQSVKQLMSAFAKRSKAPVQGYADMTADQLRARVAELELTLTSNIMSQHTPDARREQSFEHAAKDYQAAWQSTVKERDAAVKERDDLKRLLENETKMKAGAWRTIEDLKRQLEGVVEQLSIPSGAATELVLFEIKPAKINGGKPYKQTYAPAKTNGHARVRETPGRHPPAKQRILDMIALMNRLRVPVTAITLPCWLGCHQRNKSFTNTLSSLRSSGHVEGYALTDRGWTDARAIPAPTDRAALEEMILVNLQPIQQRLMRQVLNWGRADQEHLSKAMGYDHPRNKSFTNTVSSLRARGLLTPKWPVQATDVFNLGGS